ncbi:MAG: MYG1 family protein [Verrucomicrobia bacterium]|nr:MYG1 family protein [Verrucomicrobiota bacterium]MCH8513856.1 MYG1 family protein [Kiritimatiellia bacterium]
MPTLILTHPGSAHADDLIACTVCSAVHGGLPIERRSPTEADLADPGTAVLDQGLRWEPALWNFDHHQDDPSVYGRCATSLLLEHLLRISPQELPEQVPWLPAFECWDARGPGALGRSHGLDMAQTISIQYDPTGMLLRDIFAAQTHIAPDQPLGQILKAMGQRLLDDIDQRRTDFALLDDRVQCVESAGLSGLLLEPLPGEDDLPKFMKEWIALRHPKIAFYITLNRRGGISLTRWGENPDLNFHRLQDRSDIRYTHPGGFLAVFQGPISEALSLIPQARVT